MLRLQVVSALSALGAVLPSASAQTFLVDRQNRPGTDYTSIAAAVAAVPDGSTLLVLGRGYQAFVIDGKGLTIRGAGASVGSGFPGGPVEVRNLGPQQTVTLAGLELSGRGGPLLWLRNCAGAVQLDDVTFGASQDNADLYVENCTQVMARGVRRTSLLPVSAVLRHSDVSFEGCEFHGRFGYQGGPAIRYSAPGMTVTGGVTRLTNCQVFGGSGPISLGGDKPAVHLLGGRVELRPPGLISSVAPNVIDGSGTVVRDPSFAFAGARLTAPGITLTTGTLPTVLGSSAGPGGSLRATATGLGVPTVLVLGWPGPPTPVPGVLGELWLAPGLVTFAAFGIPPLSSQIAVPTGSAFLGVRFGWQAVAFGGATATASNPTWVVVR